MGSSRDGAGACRAHNDEYRHHVRADAFGGRRGARVGAPGAPGLGLRPALRVELRRGTRERRHAEKGAPVLRGGGRPRHLVPDPVLPRQERTRGPPGLHDARTLARHVPPAAGRTSGQCPGDVRGSRTGPRPPRFGRPGRAEYDAGAVARHARSGLARHRPLPRAAEWPPGGAQGASPAGRLHRAAGPVAAAALGARRQRVPADPQVGRRLSPDQQRAPDHADRPSD